MDLDYFQHVAETSSTAMRVAYRIAAIAIVTYGGYYVLTALPALSAAAASDEYLE
jgi:hypothetical protein